MSEDPVCEVHATHSPRPLAVVEHHIQPKAMGGVDLPANKVWTCDTGHRNIHRLLGDLIRTGRMRREGTREEHRLALLGYRQWVAQGKPGKPVFETHLP